MARYNREFLVPYLQSVCALHLASRKLCEKIHFLKQTIGNLKLLQNDLCPDPPVLKPVFTVGRVLSMMVGMCGIFGILVGFFMKELHPILQIVFLSSSFCLVCVFLCGSIYCSIKTFADNRYKMRDYKGKLLEYEESNAENSNSTDDIPILQAQLQRCISENHRVCSLLNQVYYANIIPRPFRNIHSVIYLYDWFRTSRADDLDVALTMLVHNQNNDKLNQIVDRQATIIVEQAIALANQQYSLDKQHYRQEMLAKLTQLADNTEEYNTYLSMIESITAAADYFAVADYLKKI